MKKLFASILILAMVFAITPAAFATSAVKPIDPNMGEYGIPIYASPKEVDLRAVFEGHTIRNILDHFDSFAVKGDILQVQPDSTYDLLAVDYYFRDAEHEFVRNSEITSKEYNSTTYELFLYDEEDPYVYSKYSGGTNKYEVPVESIESARNNEIIPFITSTFNYSVTSYEEEDGLYVLKFDVTPKTDLGKDVAIRFSFDNCSVKIDPATSLIRAFNYHETWDGGELTGSVVVEYIVDKEPDYSIKD